MSGIGWLMMQIARTTLPTFLTWTNNVAQKNERYALLDEHQCNSVSQLQFSSTNRAQLLSTKSKKHDDLAVLSFLLNAYLIGKVRWIAHDLLSSRSFTFGSYTHGLSGLIKLNLQSNNVKIREVNRIRTSAWMYSFFQTFRK